MKSPPDSPASSRKRGRPLAFDRELALERAMLLFWDRGYEATSLQSLTEAMGINPPSLYAAFGGKEQLFLAAVERYLALHGDDPDVLVKAPTARAAVDALLARSVLKLSGRDVPHGCLLMLGTVNCRQDAAGLQRRMAAYRAEGQKALARRIAAGIADGELHADCDAAALAAFYATVIQGMSLQARDGATRAELQRVAGAAMLAWPSRPPVRREPSAGETPKPSRTAPKAR